MPAASSLLPYPHKYLKELWFHLLLGYHLVHIHNKTVLIKAVSACDTASDQTP